MGLSFVARSDCMGNAKASKSGTSYGKKLPAFFVYMWKREDTKIADVRFGRVTDKRLVCVKSKNRFVTETSHAIHEFFYMLSHYKWRRSGEALKRPMLVFMVNNAKGFYIGGMVDRFKGIISTYAWCKQRNIDFRIRHVYPFELSDYLQPAKYDWCLKEQEFTTCIWDARLMRARGEYGRRLVKKNLRRKQLHYYGNRDFLQYINHTGGTDYSWGELFKEIFKPKKVLQDIVEDKKAEIGQNYISAVYRFQNLLGDFREYSYKALEDENNREELIKKCLNGLMNLQKQHPGIPILVTSDSSTFIRRASGLSGIYTIGGERVHMGCIANASYDTYLNSFVDFYMLADSQKIFCLGY